MDRCGREVRNRTNKDLTLYDENKVPYMTIPRKGKAKSYTEDQIESQKEYASRVQEKRFFVKCMIEEEKVIELLKDDLKTYYALNILKHFLKPDHNVIVKVVRDENGNKKTVKYTADDLGFALGKSRQTGSYHIRRLIELNIIQPIKTKEYGKCFAINPEYYMNGTYVPQEIYDLFDMSKRGQE